MYIISWVSDSNTGSKELSGDCQSILALAHLLENKKVRFQVTKPGIGPVKQDHFGCGGFQYWHLSLYPDPPQTCIWVNTINYDAVKNFITSHNLDKM